MTITVREWSARLADLLRRERSAMAEFLAALAEFHARRLWEPLGYPSLFYFLHRELRLPKGPAFYRKTAAELVQQYPELLEPLRDGRLCLTSVVELSKVITPENRSEILPRFFGLSRRDAQDVVAAIRPAENPPLREVVTEIRVSPVPAAPRESIGEPAAEGGSAPTEETPALGPANERVVLPAELLDANSGGPGGAVTRPQPFELEPLSANLSRLHITVSKRLLEKIDAARAALSHSHPGASAGTIIEAGLDLLLERAAKRKGLVERPRATPRPTTTDAIPAAVKREVWRRAGGKCEWTLDGGGVCGSTLRLELDHIIPRALGGAATVENIRLTCRGHNQLAARQVFGDAHMDRFTRGSSGHRRTVEVMSGHLDPDRDRDRCPATPESPGHRLEWPLVPPAEAAAPEAGGAATPSSRTPS